MDDEAARERFGMIPLRAASEAGLAGCDYRVLSVIASLANERGFAWPSLKTIASLARTTVPKVSPAIKKLEAAGLLRKQNRVTARGDWNSNVYQVLLQKGVPTAGCGSRVALPVLDGLAQRFAERVDPLRAIGCDDFPRPPIRLVAGGRQ